jgi:flagellar basal body rod protein FlgG
MSSIASPADLANVNTAGYKVERAGTRAVERDEFAASSSRPWTSSRASPKSISARCHCDDLDVIWTSRLKDVDFS